MSLIEELRLRLDVCDRARAFYSAICNLEQNDPEVTKLVAALGASIEALGAYENPPVQVAVQSPLPTSRHERIALLQAQLRSCPAGSSTAYCERCTRIRVQLAELGVFP